jgi:predicted nucleic acid-binding protein
VKVVSDTSPICYLLLIGEIDLLPILYERIYIPQAVAAELRHPKAPSMVRGWMGSTPGWLEILTVDSRVPPDLKRIQAGERETILLTEDLGAELVILDDRRAREVALGRGLVVTGLLGVLGQAAKARLVSLPEVFGRLQQTSFRTTSQAMQDILDRHSR